MIFPERVFHIIERELAGLRKQLEAYSNEKDIWETPHNIKNSAGTLALHLVGNLRHYIGAYIGTSGYVRDRKAEFVDRNIPRTEIFRRIDLALAEVKTALENVSEAELDKTYPLDFGGKTFHTKDFLLHLVSHLAYHLGQIDYHRRFVTGQPEGAGAISLRDLKTG